LWSECSDHSNIVTERISVSYTSDTTITKNAQSTNNSLGSSGLRDTVVHMWLLGLYGDQINDHVTDRVVSDGRTVTAKMKAGKLMFRSAAV
jgi:hypothetical protein